MTDFSGAELIEFLADLVEERNGLALKLAEAEKKLDQQRRQPTRQTWDPATQTIKEVPTGYTFPSQAELRAFGKKMRKMTGREQNEYVQNDAEGRRLHHATCVLSPAHGARAKLERFDKFVEDQLNNMNRAQHFFNAVGSREFASFGTGFKNSETLQKRVKELHALARPIVRAFFRDGLSFDEIKQTYPQAIQDFIGALASCGPLWNELNGEQGYWKFWREHEEDIARILKSKQVEDAQFGRKKEGSPGDPKGAAMLVAMLLDGPHVWRTILAWSGHDGKK